MKDRRKRGGREQASKRARERERERESYNQYSKKKRSNYRNINIMP